MNDKEVKKGWFIAGIISIILAVSLPFILITIFKTNYTVNELGKLGAVGDFFGGSTIGLLSIASIFFIIHTISIQSKELALQRQELQLTRNELKETRKVHEDANDTLLVQRFESTFFNMLTFQNELVNNLNIHTANHGNKIGRDATTFLYNKFELAPRDMPGSDRLKMQEATTVKESNIIVFDFFMNRYGDYIQPYFRNLYTIINYIDSSLLSEVEKVMYLNILRAQLSKSELKLVFYNAVLKDEVFKGILLKYDFFEDYIGPWDLRNPEHYKLLNE